MLNFENSDDILNGLKVEIIEYLEGDKTKFRYLEGQHKNRTAEISSKNIILKFTKVIEQAANDEECLESFENIENQTIERFY